MKNLEIVKILSNIADILELQEVQFKPQAYKRAAMAIESLTEDIEEIYHRNELENIPGVGKHIAEKIKEIIETGKLNYYEKLKKEVKVDIEQLNEIPFLGPKKIKILYKKLGIKDIDDLEKAIQQKKLRQLAGFGEKTEQTISEGIKLIHSRPKRFLYAQVQPIVEEIINNFARYDFVHKIEIAGSFRRRKETVGDLDFLIVSSKPDKVMKIFTSLPDIKDVLAAGTTRSSICLTNGLQVDLRIVVEKEFGSALLYFIGNKQHNIGLRKLALKKGYTLSEYGLFKIKGKKWVGGRTEQEIYQKLGLHYIEPELRENTGELYAAQQGKLPNLVTAADINGIFHNHSNWSDGSNTLLEMAQAAENMKLKFISFNDHYSSIGITNPLNEKRLKKYLEEIDKIQKKVGIKIYSGVEIDIMKDGSLPLSPAKLKELDVVIAAVHTSHNLDEASMTARVCAALQGYPINILGHPTGRLLQSREPSAINLDKVFQTAKSNNVFLEINSFPHRLDLSGENIKSAVDIGCQFALSTDAHDLLHLPFYTLGVNMARRGWLEKKNILNCWDLTKIESNLKK